MTLCDKKAPPDQEYPDRDECLWRPTDTLQQKCVDEYCKKAQEQFNINVERVCINIYSLFWGWGLKLGYKRYQFRHMDRILFGTTYFIC